MIPLYKIFLWINKKVILFLTVFFSILKNLFAFNNKILKYLKFLKEIHLKNLKKSTLDQFNTYKSNFVAIN